MSRKYDDVKIGKSMVKTVNFIQNKSAKIWIILNVAISPNLLLLRFTYWAQKSILKFLSIQMKDKSINSLKMSLAKVWSFISFASCCIV